MNYLKIKTIQKQLKIIGGSSLGTLLFSFLLVSCGTGGPHNHGSTDSHHGHGGATKPQFEHVHQHIMAKVGGLTSTTDVSFKETLIEAAKSYNKKHKIEGRESLRIPKKTKDGMPILKAITSEPVEGDEATKKKWHRWITMRKNKQKVKLKEATGRVGEMLMILADAKERHKDPVIYAVMLVMALQTELKNSNNATELDQALKKFHEGIEKVSPEGNGVRVLIKTDEPDQPEQIEFLHLEVKKKSRKNRCYILPAATYEELMTTYEELKKEIEPELAKLS